MSMKLILYFPRQEACIYNLVIYDGFPDISLLSYFLMSYPSLLSGMGTHFQFGIDPTYKPGVWEPHSVIEPRSFPDLWLWGLDFSRTQGLPLPLTTLP